MCGGTYIYMYLFPSQCPPLTTRLGVSIYLRRQSQLNAKI